MHTPVLLKEVIEILNPEEGRFFVDGTLDGGGYFKEIIKRMSAGGIFLGIEWDEELLNVVKNELHKNAKLYGIKLFLKSDNYANLPKIVKEEKLPLVDGMVLDLGFSFWHIEESGRGFSFNKDEPLLMVYDRNSNLTAYDVVNFYPANKIAEIIYKYGEEKNSFAIAREIVKKRKIKKIETSKELAEIILGILRKKTKIHPATKTFQALRIYVNNELENLERILKELPFLMNKGGRVVIVSFHSLEDRIVKNYFQNWAKEKKAVLISKKPLVPSYQELKSNPKSRSAKLRAIRFI